MGKRMYNVLFHTHTVSGIVISVALYIIFFAGSFSFFRDEIINWERGHQVEIKDEIAINIDTALSHLGQQYELRGRDINLRHYYNERQVGVSLSASKDSTASKEARVGAFFYLDTEDKSTATYPESYTLGEFLYRLHFFAQIPYPYGYHLSGFTAFFFLFTILTGIIIHWRKIVTNFYVFRPWAKLKTIWTDSHTALGLIGFPFQLVYALTGAFFMLQSIVMAPYIAVLYNGDQQAFDKALEQEHSTYEYSHRPLSGIESLSKYTAEVQSKWIDFKITELKIDNYGDQNMYLTISGNIDPRNKMNGIGKITYKVADQNIVYEKNPMEKNSYADVTKNILSRLHLADYAGYGLRIISFILGLISCYVILSGVMIWLVARDKKSVSDKQKKFNQSVVFWYLAICLSMYPMVALEFVLVKLFAPAGMTFIYKTFFIGWLVLSIFFAWKKNNAFTTKWSLGLGAVLGLFIPLVNWIESGNWIWDNLRLACYDIAFIDIFWIALSVFSLLSLRRMKQAIVLDKKSGKTF
ncbi:MAG: PepSY-associated TM helix domain-containing protein [Bacteroidota bacterium]